MGKTFVQRDNLSGYEPLSKSKANMSKLIGKANKQGEMNRNSPGLRSIGEER